MRKNKKKLFIFALIIMALIVGSSLAYLFTILQGTKENTIELQGTKITYTESKTKMVSTVMSEEEGLNSDSYYEIKVKKQGSGASKIKYAIYIEPEAENTVSPNRVHFYLTDENNRSISNSMYNSKGQLISPYRTLYGYNQDSYEDGYHFYNENTKERYKFHGEEHIKKVVVSDNQTNEIIEDEVNDDGYLIEYSSGTIQITDTVSVNKRLKDMIWNFMQFYPSPLYVKDVSQNVCLKYEHIYGNGNNNSKLTIEPDASLCTYEYRSMENLSANYETILDSSGKGLKYDFSNQKSVYYVEARVLGEYGDWQGGRWTENETIDANFHEFFKHEMGKNQNESVDFYVSDQYGAYQDNKQCLRYTIGTSNIENLTEKGNSCTPGWVLIRGRAKSITLGELDSSQDELTNVILNNGVFKTGTSDETHTYRLRYWIDDNSPNDLTEESVPTTDEDNVHSAAFGSQGKFQFKVSVYARQAE